MRGWNCSASHSHPDRLSSALVRGSRGLVAVAGEEAVAEVASRLRAAESVPLIAIGPLVANEDAAALRHLAEVTGAGLCTTDLSGAPAARLALQRVLGRPYGLTDLEAIARADVVWLFGVDPPECPQVASRVTTARRAGGRVVRFDVHATGGRDGARAVGVPPDRLGGLAVSLQRAAFRGGLVVPKVQRAPGFDAMAGCISKKVNRSRRYRACS